jgi:exopolyphosphatase/guanosine-5'-triphosphate,3'-diphosphate pyrophosphatase
MVPGMNRDSRAETPGAALHAALDLGSNMFRLVVGSSDKPRGVRVLRKVAEVVTVAEGLFASGALQSVPLERAARTLERFREVLAALPIVRTCAVATGAFRSARNGFSAAQSLAAILGAEVAIIDGDREAELAVRGVRSAASEAGRIGLVDVGGVSTELLLEGKGGAIRRSVDVGVVTLTERIPESVQSQDARDEYLRNEATAALHSFGEHRGIAVDRFYAVGGAAVAMAAHRDGLPYVTFSGDGSARLRRTELDELYRDYAAADPRTRAARIGISERHGNLIPAGYAILTSAMDRLAIESVVPSGRGVAEGLLATLCEAHEENAG